MGKYAFKIPYLGAVMDVLSSTWGFLIIIVLPMLLFFIYQVYHLVIVGMNLKRAMAEEDRMKQAKAEQASAAKQAADERAQAEAARAEAEAALAEAKRLKAEAEAALASAKSAEEGSDESGK